MVHNEHCISSSGYNKTAQDCQETFINNFVIQINSQAIGDDKELMSNNYIRET